MSKRINIELEGWRVIALIIFAFIGNVTVFRWIFSWIMEMMK